MRTGSARPRRSTCTWPRCGASWRRIRRRRATSRPCGASAFASRPRRRTRAVSLRTRLLLSLAYVLVLAVVSLGVPLALSLRERVNAEVHSQALSQADVVAATAADLLSPPNTKGLEALVRSAGATVRGRVLIVNALGKVLADSTSTSTIGSSYSSPSRPEIVRALRGSAVQTQRNSHTLGEDILATAVPIVHQTRTIGYGCHLG